MSDIIERLRAVCEVGCDPELPYEAVDEIERLRARVAELEAAKEEPVAWMNPYGGTLQVRITGLEYEKYTIPLYTAPPAPSSALSLSVAVNAIMEAVAIEREACAKIVADAAPGFCGGRAETVLYSVAETIRARGER